MFPILLALLNELELPLALESVCVKDRKCDDWKIVLLCWVSTCMLLCL